MSAKHTPGPWTHTGQGDITGIETNGENHGPVDVCCVYLRAVPGRTEANARLVAAAPELLEALEEVCRVIESDPVSINDTILVTGNSPETLYDHCRAAISKALGESA